MSFPNIKKSVYVLTCVATTKVNCEKNDGLDSIKFWGYSSINFAFTASFNSCRKAQTVFALDCPTLDSSTNSINQEKQNETTTPNNKNKIYTNIKRKSAGGKFTQEIISKVPKFDFRAINNSDTSDSTENQIFQGFWAGGTTVQQAYAWFL